MEDASGALRMDSSSHRGHMDPPSHCQLSVQSKHCSLNNTGVELEGKAWKAKAGDLLSEIKDLTSNGTYLEKKNQA